MRILRGLHVSNTRLFKEFKDEPGEDLGHHFGQRKGAAINVPRRLSENSIRGQGLFENDHQISSDYFMKSDYLPQILFWLLITDFVLQKTAA